MDTNVYSVKGKVLVIGTCLEEVYPKIFSDLSEKADQVYALCLETTHVNMAITKLSAILATGQVTHLVFASVDRSPHCTQIHYITHEIERTLKEHVPIDHYVVSDGELVPVSQEAIDLSKSLGKLAKMSTESPHGSD